MDSGSPQDPLVRAVTHELRQPLSLIVGYTELLETHELAAADRVAILAEIRRAAARMAGVLRRLDRPEELLNPGPPWSELALSA